MNKQAQQIQDTSSPKKKTKKTWETLTHHRPVINGADEIGLGKQNNERWQPKENNNTKVWKAKHTKNKSTKDWPQQKNTII